MAHVTKIENFTPPGFRWISLKKLSYVDGQGKTRSWEMAQRITSAAKKDEIICNAVAIVAVVSSEAKEDQLVLVSQFRPPINKEVLEVPAGLVDEGEDAANAALRELKEETGYSGEVTHVSPIVYSDPGMTDASMRYVFIKVDGDLPQNLHPVATPDEGESITVHTVPVNRLLEEIEAFRASQGFEVDARLYGLASSMNLRQGMGGGSRFKGAGPNMVTLSAVLAMVVTGGLLAYRLLVPKGKTRST